MAQTLFEALAAGVASIDSQTAMAVQSLLESQNVAEASQAVVEEEDVFQCGKCKKQFTSLQDFVGHKQTPCVPTIRKLQTVQHSVGGMSTNANTVFTTTMPQVVNRQPPPQQVTYSAVPASPLTQTLGPGMVLTDDLMALTSMDQATLQAATLQVATSISNSPFLSQVNAPITIRPASTAVSMGTPGTAITTVSTAAGSQQSLTTAAPGSAFSPAALPGTLPAQITIQPMSSFVNGQLTAGQPLVVTSGVPGGGTEGAKLGLTLPIIKTSPTKAGRKASQQQAQQQAQQQQQQQQQQANVITVVADLDATLKQRRMGKPHTTTINLGGTTVTAASLLEDTTPKRKLTCQYCDKTFSKNFDLQQHVRSHTGEKPFQCIVCGRAFAQKSNVKKHMQTHKVWPSGSSDTLPKNPIITATSELATLTGELGQLQEVTVHVDKQSATGVRSGVEMSIGTTLEEGPGGNTTNVVIDNSYLCQYCPEKFKTYFQLKSHMTNHKNQQVYRCILKTCMATFSDLDAFLEHTKAHEEVMTYRCHMCSKHFPSLYDLGVHQYSHSLYPNQGPKPGPRYFRCTKCNNKYSTPEALEHHLATTSHSYPCTHCEKTFTCERYLRRHLPTHGTVGEHQCDQCEKRFKTEHYLKMHMLIHSGEKPYTCEACDAKFNRKDKLKRHMLIHDPVKKYKCPFRSHTGCTKEFNRPDKLKAHIISHSGIKPYKCQECGKAFSRRPHLIEHERTHRDDYKFRCEKCGRGFFREKQCAEHKCRPEKEGEDGTIIRQPELYRRRSKRKVGRPRRRMITVTEETVKETRRVIGRGRGRWRRGLGGAAQAAVRMSSSANVDAAGSSSATGESAVAMEVSPEQHQAQGQEVIQVLEEEEQEVVEHYKQQMSQQLHEHQQQQEQHSQETEYQLIQQEASMTGDGESVSLTPISVSLGNTYQTATIPMCSSSGGVPKEICVQIHPLQGSLVSGQTLEDGSEVPTQVITIDPHSFGAEAVNLDPSQIMTSQGHFEGNIEALQAAVSDVANLGTATLIATGPNMAAIVVNTPSGEILTTDASGAMMAGSQTVSYVTAEQFESLQASVSEQNAIFAGTETILQSSEMLRQHDQG